MESLLSGALKPFSILAGFIVVLLALEILLMAVGLSSAVETEGAEGIDGADFDAGFDFDAAPAVEADLFTPDELAILDLPHHEQSAVFGASKPPLARRLLRAVGIGRGPLLVSLTCMAAGVSACGFFLQFLLRGLTGEMLPGGAALAAVLIPGLLLGGRLAALAARAVPQFESHAVSDSAYNGRRGHVVIGLAGRGSPAQVRWRDSHGTTHSLMAEPLRDAEEIPAGAEVLILRTRDRQPRLLRVD